MTEVLDPRVAAVLQNHRDRPKQNVCVKVGRKIVTERQRRILCGLDVTNRSMDTTAGSQDATLEEDSWLDSSSKRRLELIRQRRSLTRRIGKSMGGNFNQFTMEVPPFEPRIEVNASCSEDSADEEPVQEEENVGGSQGRKGEGCSTPRHVNNTLAALRDIEISVVDFNNSTDPEKQLPPLGNNTVEMVDVESSKEQSSLEVITAFKQPEKPLLLPLPSSEDIKGGTFVVEEKDIETTGGTGGTYTIRKGSPECKLTIVPQKSSIVPPTPPIKPTLLKDGRKSMNKRQSVQFASEVISPASRSFGFSASKLAKHSRIIIDTPKFGRRPDDSDKLSESMRSVRISNEKTIEFSSPSMIDAETDPRNSSYNQETPKRSGDSRLSRRSFAVEEKPKITVETKGPRYSQPTIAFLAKSPRLSGFSHCRHHISNYTQPGSEYSGDDSSTLIEIDPTMTTDLLKSGYRPRQPSKFQIQQRMKALNADFGDNQENKFRMEERRKDFIERRLINTKPTTPSRSFALPTAPQSVEKKPAIHMEHSVAPLPPLEPLEDVSLPTATAMISEGAPLEEFGSERNLTTTRGERMSLVYNVSATRRSYQLEDIDEGGDPYENDEVETTAEEGIVIQQRRGQPELDSIFAADVPSPLGEKKKSKKHRHQVDDSVVEDFTGRSFEMILKPRKLIRPESPTDGLRRSKRTRMPPVRTWMGEQAVYESTPGGSKRLVGSNKVVVRDPRYIKAKTTDPIKALERERGFR